MTAPKTKGRALITGVAGFAGSHLADLLLDLGWEVTGTDRPGISRSNLDHLRSRLRFRQFDILDPRGLEKLAADSRPEVVFHLAAVAYIPYAEHYPYLVFDINTKGVLNLVDVLARTSPAARLVLVSSSQVYGTVPAEKMPIREDFPPAPVNVYGASKLAAEEIARAWSRSGQLETVIVRPFNHFGPRQRPDFVISDWARQIAMAEAGLSEASIRVGNLEAARDFSDVRDMVRAYLAVAEKGMPDKAYNISSGRAYRVGDILQLLLERARIPIAVREDRERLRAREIPLVVGDCAVFRADTGWSPEHSLEDGLGATLDYWRSRFRKP